MKFSAFIWIALVVCHFSCSNIDEDYHVQGLNCIVFFIPECPASKVALSEIVELSNQFSNENIQFTLVLSDRQPNHEYLELLGLPKGVSSLIELDTTLEIARTHGATTTPQVFLYDDLDNLIYSGQVSDYYYKYGKHKTSPSNYFLKNAIESALSRKAVTPSVTSPIGCRINFD